MGALCRERQLPPMHQEHVPVRFTGTAGKSKQGREGGHLLQGEAVAHDAPGARVQAVHGQGGLRQVAQVHLPPQVPQHRRVHLHVLRAENGDVKPSSSEKGGGGWGGWGGVGWLEWGEGGKGGGPPGVGSVERDFESLGVLWVPIQQESNNCTGRCCYCCHQRFEEWTATQDKQYLQWQSMID